MSDAAATVSGMGDDVEVVFFADAAAFRAWRSASARCC